MAKSKKKFLTEFRDFALKGNVIDMAVGVIIGGAFGRIVSSLVGDIINPIFAALLQKNTLAELKLILRHADEEAGIVEASILYGSFIKNILDFIIIALSVFVFIKLFTKARNKAQALAERLMDKQSPEPSDPEPPPPPPPPEPTREETLLEEIRDILKKKAQTKE